MFQTPILFIIFNRPNQSKITFERIREIQPRYLFIAADGPRSGNQSDEVKCIETQQSILSMIDWDCELKTLFRTENLGCGNGPATAITWFFNHVEQGIILEDDCLVDLSFFRFSEDLLSFYKHDERIMHIGALSFFKSIGPDQYYFANTPFIWGWATWRRAWEKFDLAISDWPQQKKNPNFKIYKMNPAVVTFWEKKFDLIYSNGNDSKSLDRADNIWDYQWTYCLLKNNGLAIFPSTNLVSNIGFGPDATHTVEVIGKNVARKTYPIKFPLKFKTIFKNINKANYFMERENWNLHKPSKYIVLRVIKRLKHAFNIY
jgi:hypothetical protein